MQLVSKFNSVTVNEDCCEHITSQSNLQKGIVSVDHEEMQCKTQITIKQLSYLNQDRNGNKDFTSKLENRRNQKYIKSARNNDTENFEPVGDDKKYYLEPIENKGAADNLEIFTDDNTCEYNLQCMDSNVVGYLEHVNIKCNSNGSHHLQDDSNFVADDQYDNTSNNQNDERCEKQKLSQSIKCNLNQLSITQVSFKLLLNNY
jgi:hypothetical protein